MRHSKKARPAKSSPKKSSPKKSKASQRATISSSSPLGMMALHLLERWKQSGRSGLVFLAESENRAERLGSVIHALDPSCEVLVFPRLNTLPFDQLEPSREIAGRRASVLRRLAKSKRPIFLVSTAEAVMERLPPPASLSRLNMSLKVGGTFSEPDFAARLEAMGYDLDDEPDYPGGALFHGQTFEIFPAGALGPFRIEHSGRAIRRIVAFDPQEHDIIFETRELLVDPMSERLALAGKRGKRASAVRLLRTRQMDRGCRRPAARRRLAEHDRGRPRAAADREREYLGRRDWKQADQGHEGAAADGSFQTYAGIFEADSFARKALRAFVEETRRAGSRLIFVAAQEEDLRAMERMSGVKAERLRGLGRGDERTRPRSGDSGRSRRGLRRSRTKASCRRDGVRRARQQGPSSAADGASLECGLRSCRRAGTGHGGRSSPARPRRARWLADREHGRRRDCGR